MILPRFHAFIAGYLAFSLGLLTTVSAACNMAKAPTAPSGEAASEAPLIGSQMRTRVVSATADSIEVEGMDDELGGRFKVRIDGMASERPVYYLNGELVGELFGLAGTQPARRVDAGRSQALVLHALLPPLAVALSAWGTISTLDACTRQLFAEKGKGTIEQAALNCFSSAVVPFANKLTTNLDWVTLQKVVDKLRNVIV
jgi:hypothetical protein